MIAIVDYGVGNFRSVERALVQIQMPRMSETEIKQIVEIGLKKLTMTISTPALRQIVKLSQGLPHYAHLLGLNSVRAAIDGRILMPRFRQGAPGTR